MILLALDAADVIEGALESVPPAAEVVVADGGSRDGTRRIAERLGARVVDQDRAAIAAGRGNFDLARNAAADTAGRPWVLHLDADERVSPALAREISELLADDPEHDGYRIPRLNLFWGRPVRLLGEDLQLRIARRGAGRFEGTELHRPMRVDGTVGRLDAPLVHHNVRSWGDLRRRWRRDVPLEAAALAERPGLREVCTAPLHLLRYHYLGQRAWRDGPLGLVVSMIYAARHGAVLWRRRREDRA